MKRLTTFLMALLLTAVGANAQTDYSYMMSTLSTTGWNGEVTPALMDWGIEAYGTDGAAFSTGKVMYQTITGLPAGNYTVTFYAFARVARDNELPTADTQSSIAQAYAVAGDGTASTQALTIPTVYTASHTGWTDDDIVTLTVTLAEGESLEYGIQNATAGGQWYGISAISLISDATPEELDLTTDPTVETCVAEVDHWKITGHHANGAFHQNTWSTEADASGMAVPFIEYWIGSGAQLDAANINHYQLGGLPAGYYSVSIDARAFDENTLTQIAAGDIFFTANDHSIDIASGTHGTYGGVSAEVYGTYIVYAEVTDAGTLDIRFSISSESHCDWIAFKNLNVTYLGTTLDYTLGEPTCTATSVAPGGEVGITFPNCISPSAGETPTLSSTAKITVDNDEVEPTLSYDGFTATVTFTLPSTITAGSTTTVTVPAGLLTWADTEVSSPAENVTFTLNTVAIAEGDYLIVDAEGNYLGGGLVWGTQATILGKPQFIGLEVSGDYYNLDSHQNNSATAHYLGSNLYFDNATPVNWTIAKVDGGYTIYGTVDTGTGYLTSSGTQQQLATVESSAYTWKLLTMDDVIASMDEATEETPVDVTALIKAPELKRNSNTVYYPTWTVTGYSDTHSAPSNYVFGGGEAVANCAESYHSTNGFNFSQEITLPLAGTYTLSAKGFYRDDYTDETTPVPPVMYAGDQTSTFPEITRNDEYLGVADNMANAYQEFLLGLHQIDTITITTYSSGETVTIGFKGEDTGLWNIMGELDLQYLGVVEETVTWEMTTANWGTLILPFAVAAADVPEDLTIYTCDGTETTTDEDTGESTTTVTVTGVTTGIAANTPYLVKGNVTEDTEYTFSGTPVELEAGETLTKGLLTGTFETLDYDDLSALETDGSTVYLLQHHATGDDGGVDESAAFYPVNTSSAETGVTLTPYHCYLTLPSGTNPVRGYISFPDSDGEATGIVAVEGTEVASDAIYDLSGRKVSKAVKGVYIMNGKKVLVK